MMSHIEARGVIERAWPLVTSDAPSRPELQITAAVAHLETGYGSGWQGEGIASNNWGSVKCVAQARPPCDPDCFVGLDRDGEWCFRRYTSPEEGAAAVVRLLTVRRPTVWAAMRAGDVRRVAREMSRTGYFEADPSAYATALESRVRAIAAELGEVAAGSGRTSSGGLGAVVLGAVAAAVLASRARRRVTA